MTQHHPDASESGPQTRPFDTEITDSPERAASFVLRSLPVAFPTETVYGLGASVYDERGIRRIYEAKERPPSNPLIAHVAALDQIERLTARIPDDARRLIERFFPGPLTLVLEKSRHVPGIATAGLSTVGVRMPDQATARALIEAVGSPLVAPSANRSGRPSPTTWQAVQDDLAGRIACILCGERARSGLESTVLDCTGPTPVLLRPGSIPLEDLLEIVPGIEYGIPPDEQAARSPGMRFRHYAPNAPVILIDDPQDAAAAQDAAYIGLTAPPHPGFRLQRVVDGAEAYAFELFDFFRACDREGIRRIYCQMPDEDGLGRALRDRLMRAAEAR